MPNTRPDDITLVTGGSGSIGVPLLESRGRDGRTTVALVRGGLPVNVAGVQVVEGDIQSASLGLDAGRRDELLRRVTSIVHAAALTRFDAPLDTARAVNVEGTRRVLEFAERCTRLERVTVLSTIYVAGKRTGIIRETELDHDRGFVNAYEQSKYEAEQLARAAMARLPVMVVRLSTVVGAHGSGAVGKPAAIHHAMRFLYNSLLPMMPGTDDSLVDLISTGYAVAAIRHLSERGFTRGATFHVCAAGEAPREAELIDLVVEAFMRYRPAWRRRAIEKPSIVELPTFELFRESVEAVADPVLRASVAVLAPFAPQLAFPKTFDDTQCRAILDAAGIHRDAIRDTLKDVVRFLIETNWTPPCRS
jgi:nucleoside-diphosphate-sugar epimerase